MPKQRNAKQALETLQWVCSRMERCESDVRRSLYRWQVPKEDWDSIIDQLRKDKFLDNRRYAMAYVREKASLSNWGPIKIEQNLRAKGITKEIITEVMAEVVDRDELNEKLEVFIKARIKRDRPKAKDSYDLRGRVFRAAASRGFDFESINSLLDRYVNEEF